MTKTCFNNAMIGEGNAFERILLIKQLQGELKLMLEKNEHIFFEL